ncbi:MAG: hypothetical protein NT045_08115 [Candidatus Aureabacteria bacterium]|nr:hypothetical protein [Candidatus Auribacterota bacterium]
MMEGFQTGSSTPVGAGTPERGNPMSLIKTVGICAIILGLIPLLSYIRPIAYLFAAMQSGQIPREKVPFILAAVSLSLVLPVAKIISGWGVVKVQQWGRRVAIGVFTIDFLLVFAGAVHFCLYCYRMRSTPSELYRQFVAGTSAAMWPAYIFALIGLLFVAFLYRDQVKNAFGRIPGVEL